MRFESLKYEHLSQMAEIESEAFDTPWNVNMFIPELSDDNAYYSVGVEGGEVICYGGFHKVLDEAHITNIAVRADKRGVGIGAAVMEHMITLAQMVGIKRMTLEVKDTNEPAIRLYKRFGFKVEGVRKRYYDNRYDALIMWLTIGED